MNQLSTWSPETNFGKRMIIGFLFLFLLMGCGSSEQPSPTQSAESTSTPTPLLQPTTASEPTQEEATLPLPTTEESAETTSVPPDEGFDRREMLSNLGYNIILPCHEEFVTQTAALEQAIHALQSDPSEVDLVAAQEQWKVTTEIWKYCELYALEPVMYLHSQIGVGPATARFVEFFIEGIEGEIGSDYIEASGPTSKGLPAIEYLIFDSETDNTTILATLVNGNEGKRMLYLVALAENLNDKAEELLNVWAAEGDNYIEAFIRADEAAGPVQGSINMLANEMIIAIEKVLHQKLGLPLMGTDGTPLPEAAEAYYSGHSIPLIINDLRSFQRTFNGETWTGDNQLGFDDYLNFLGVEYEGQPMPVAINEQIEKTITAIEAINQPLHTAVMNNPEVVSQAQAEVQKLLVLVKVDMVNHLGVTITFSDSDGD